VIGPWTSPEVATFCAVALVAWGVLMGWLVVDGGVISSMLDDEGGE
jgi:uncharacterized membrane protein